jgi:alcohol dehydrogenase YqhD (iron-dependent ADH family)
MNSFTLYIPTRLFFGADQLDVFVKAVARLGKHALIVTGGGSVQKLGYLDTVSSALTKAGIKVSFFTGIEPNPEAETINKAAEYLRSVKADFVLALGGGSVMDAAKAIAALAHTGEKDVWPFVLGGSRAFQLTGALPIVAIPTTSATASEVTHFSVISNRAAQGKSFLAAEFLKPTVSWLNPAFTVGLSPTTTRDGAADILSHVLENYLLGGNDSALADRHAEGVMATVLETLPRVLAKPASLEARGDLQWAATLALCGLEVVGRRESQYPLHSLEHGLSAFKPELAHGRGLATLYPTYFRWLLAKGVAVDRLAKLGDRLFKLTGDEPARVRGFIEKFEQWLKDNGLWQSLYDLGFTDADFSKVADYVVKVYGDGQQLVALSAMPVDEIVLLFKGTKRQARG